MPDTKYDQKFDTKSEFLKELNRILEESGIELEITEERYEAFEKAFREKRDRGEKIGLISTPSDASRPADSGKAFHYLIVQFSGEQYHINAKNFSLVGAALLLDNWLTAGAASALIGLSGKTTQAISKLSTKYGEYCHICMAKTLQDKKKPVSPNAVWKEIHGNQCQFARIGCVWMNQLERCTVPEAHVDGNFKQMAGRECLVRSGIGWKVPL